MSCTKHWLIPLATIQMQMSVKKISHFVKNYVSKYMHSVYADDHHKPFTHCTMQTS